jgi:pyridoxamine 5'-phosphate oxidase
VSAGTPADQAAVAVAELRRAYALGGLHERDLAPDPVAQFGRWLADTVQAGLPEPNAMVLATADPSGRPSARHVLLKAYDARGFVFYTSAGSRKGRELAANPRAVLCFPWFPLERQVTVEGPVAPVDAGEAVAYFRSRPWASRIGAWASEQSSVLAAREVLDERFAEYAGRWPEGADVPLPPGWGGWRVAPEAVEFWQGRIGRLHDRLRYRRTPEAGSPWVIERLAP